jgi:drug/metabolite transporter (DMT)-like permease
MQNYFNSLSARTRGISLILFSVFVWAGWTIVSSYGVRNSLTAYDITAMRFGTAGLILLPILLKKGLRLGPWGIWGGLWLAFMMGVPFNILAIWAMKFSPASHAALINITMLMVSTVGGIFLLREKTNALKVTGVVISLTGVVCLLAATDAGNHDIMLLGHIMFIVSGSLWGIYTLSMKIWKVDPLHTVAAVCVYSALLYIPIYVLFLNPQIGAHNWQAAAFQGFYQGLINSVFALLCFNRAVALLGASTTTAFLPLIPAIVTLSAIPVLGQVPTELEWAGVALASGGVFLSSGILGKWLGQKENSVA